MEFVDENGNSSVGISASRDLREAKNQWAGYLTTDTLSKALEENFFFICSKVFFFYENRSTYTLAQFERGGVG